MSLTNTAYYITPNNAFVARHWYDDSWTDSVARPVIIFIGGWVSQGPVSATLSRPYGIDTTTDWTELDPAPPVGDQQNDDGFDGFVKQGYHVMSCQVIPAQRDFVSSFEVLEGNGNPFASDPAWTLGTGWTFNSGSAEYAGGGGYLKYTEDSLFQLGHCGFRITVDVDILDDEIDIYLANELVATIDSTGEGQQFTIITNDRLKRPRGDNYDLEFRPKSGLTDCHLSNLEVHVVSSPFQRQVRDVKNFIRWIDYSILTSGEDLNTLAASNIVVDRTKKILIGGSNGSNLAAMAALTHGDRDLKGELYRYTNGVIDDKVQGLINVYGTYQFNLPPMNEMTTDSTPNVWDQSVAFHTISDPGAPYAQDGYPLYNEMITGWYDQEPANVKEYSRLDWAYVGADRVDVIEAHMRAISPIARISKHKVPILTIMGDSDTTNHPGQATYIDERMNKFGLDHVNIVVPDKGHNGFTSMFHSSWPDPPYDHGPPDLFPPSVQTTVDVGSGSATRENFFHIIEWLDHRGLAA